MYAQSGLAMSGMRYVAIPMGPVPDKHNSIYDFLAKKDDLDISSQEFSNGGVGERFKSNPKHKFNPDCFSSEELKVLAEVAKRFRNTSTQEIIDISHKEKGWLANKDVNGIIDYKFAFDIEL